MVLPSVPKRTGNAGHGQILEGGRTASGHGDHMIVVKGRLLAGRCQSTVLAAVICPPNDLAPAIWKSPSSRRLLHPFNSQPKQREHLREIDQSLGRLPLTLRKGIALVLVELLLQPLIDSLLQPQAQ